MITPFCELPFMPVIPACDAIISWLQNYFDVTIQAINVGTSMTEMYMSDEGSTTLSGLVVNICPLIKALGQHVDGVY